MRVLHVVIRYVTVLYYGTYMYASINTTLLLLDYCKSKNITIILMSLNSPMEPIHHTKMSQIFHFAHSIHVEENTKYYINMSSVIENLQITKI